jgi:MFS transporter, MHS family, shikimate and dehydroshikimate transport protein
MTLEQAELEPASAEVTRQRRRILASGTIGTTIEYFDFLLYGLIAPTVFGPLFFPQDNDLISTISVLGTYAVGYAARPLGGIVFGHFGDRLGRKPIMFITLIMMGLATTAIGLLPTYAAIGAAAPTLLVLLRFVQGFALGGETAGAVILAIENAPYGKRGGFAGVIQIGAALGSVFAALAAGQVARMDDDAALSWGWRVPFLLSAVLVVIGIYIRVRIDESPVFTRAVTAEKMEKAPLIAALKGEPKPCLTVFLTTITETSMLQLFTVYILTYGTASLHLSSSVLLNGILFGNIAGIITNPLFGRISDHVGRRPMIAGALVIGALYAAFAFFPMLETHNTAIVTLAIAIPPAVIQTLIFSVEGSFYAEQFTSARMRFSGLGFSRQLGGAVGGLFPLIATSLVAGTSTVWSVIGYYVLLSAISLGAVMVARETRLERLA